MFVDQQDCIPNRTIDHRAEEKGYEGRGTSMYVQYSVDSTEPGLDNVDGKRDEGFGPRGRG